MNSHTFQTDGLLILPHLRIQNANAISSPLTWGFPSPTAFLGFSHALERRLSAEFGKVFGGVGIVCHAFDAQTFKPNRRQHLIFTQSRNPIYLKRDATKFISDGTPAAIVEEACAHLEVSLVIAVCGHFTEEQEEQNFANAAYEVALGMRIAGGSVLPATSLRATKPQWVPWPSVATERRKAFARLRRWLLPGFALVHRPDLLAERLVKLKEESSVATVLDALLDITCLNHVPAQHDGNSDSIVPSDTVEWEMERRPGWLVPLPIGYAGISILYGSGEVAGARDITTPFRFVESLYSLGQWIGPHRLTQLEQILWSSKSDPDAGLYRCVNRYAELAEFRTQTQHTNIQGT
jgi:CRISPR-associated protein Csy2